MNDETEKLLDLEGALARIASLKAALAESERSLAKDKEIFTRLSASIKEYCDECNTYKILFSDEKARRREDNLKNQAIIDGLKAASAK